jgi:hypothetical protein
MFIAFPQQQWFRERASMLHYTYIVCIVKDLIERIFVVFAIYFTICLIFTATLNVVVTILLTAMDFYLMLMHFVNANLQKLRTIFIIDIIRMFFFFLFDG